jgi:hypothetical protein
MPQVYLIVSHRGVELGYAAAIHPRDFSDQAFKAKLKSLAPRIFDALPDPTSDASQKLSAELARQGYWYFRRKTRLPPKESDFGTLPDLLAFLKSAEGHAWGAATVSRYWLPHELTDDVDLAREFLNAALIFQPLMVRAEPAAPDLQLVLDPSVHSVPADASLGGSIRDGLESFMAMYPECRSRPFGTHPELWRVLSHLRQRLETLSSIARRPTISVTWSVGQGNYNYSARPANLHVREAGRFNQRYPLLCRDYLRSHPMAAEAYGAIKRRLASFFPNDPDAYYAIKDPTLDLLMVGAEDWAISAGWSEPPSD